ncbi:class I SAM-dependent methyltransferase [Chloroflexota bacterium]
MPSINNRTRQPVGGVKQGEMDVSPFDGLAPEYDAWFDKEGSRIFFIEVKAFQELLPSLPKPWLEIGVGSGRFAQALGIETGIDPSTKLVEMARNRGINAFVGRGEQRLFDEESFGTVFLIVTLCFLGAPLDVLKEANRILTPGGKIVLGLVLKESPWGQFYQQKKAEGHRFYRYATFYRCDEVVKLLVQTGFVTERIISTLFQKPEGVQHIEEPKEGYFPDAGFTIIVAGKRSGR